MARIYLAGAITNVDPLTAAENFRRAERFVEGQGHEPLNPLTLVCQKEGRDYFEYLCDAMQIMSTADAVYMIAGWRDSFGAQIEHFVAGLKGMDVFYENSLTTL